MAVTCTWAHTCKSRNIQTHAHVLCHALAEPQWQPGPVGSTYHRSDVSLCHNQIQVFHTQLICILWDTCPVRTSTHLTHNDDRTFPWMKKKPVNFLWMQIEPINGRRRIHGLGRWGRPCVEEGEVHSLIASIWVLHPLPRCRSSSKDFREGSSTRVIY